MAWRGSDDPTSNPIESPESVIDSMVGVLRHWSPTPGVATVAVAASSSAIGSAPFFLRRLSEAGLSPLSLAFFRYAITAVIVVRFLATDRDKRVASLWGLVGGAVAGLGWVAFADAIATVDVATNGVAYMSYPVFAMVTATVLFGHRIQLRSLLAGGLVLTAALFAMGPGRGFAPTLFVAPATFGFSIAVLTERLDVLDPFERLSAVSLGAAVTLGPLVASLPVDQIVPPTIEGWVWVLAIALVCALLPMLIYGAAAPSIGPARTAVAGTAELPTMYLVGAIAFGETVAVTHVVAGLLILVSVLLTPTIRALHVVPEDAPSEGDDTEDSTAPDRLVTWASLPVDRRDRR